MAKKTVTNKFLVPARLSWSGQGLLLKSILFECFTDFIYPESDNLWFREYRGLKFSFHMVRGSEGWSHTKSPLLREIQIERRDEFFNSYFKRISIVISKDETEAYFDKDDFIGKVEEMAFEQAESDKARVALYAERGSRCSAEDRTGRSREEIRTQRNTDQYCLRRQGNKIRQFDS